MKSQIPKFRSDEEAAAFLDQDLSDLDFSQFKPVSFEFAAKAAQINMRVPPSLLEAIKDRAREHGVPYTRYIRELMERDIKRLPKA